VPATDRSDPARAKPTAACYAGATTPSYSDTGEFPARSRGDRHELTAAAFVAGKTSRLRLAPRSPSSRIGGRYQIAERLDQCHASFEASLRETPQDEEFL
jgi:hypothetical protein